jgi:hypothetical protein
MEKKNKKKKKVQTESTDTPLVRETARVGKTASSDNKSKIVPRTYQPTATGGLAQVVPDRSTCADTLMVGQQDGG